MPETTAESKMRFVASRLSEDSFVPGRRDFLFFRDLGIGEASDGRYGAVVINAKAGMGASTGWHYHECDMQMVYLLKGWSHMQFEDGTDIRMEPGDTIFIPGGTLHNELAISEDLEAIEITSPAVMGTVPCDPPEGWQPKPTAGWPAA
jgi:quercetin dioxygenase-like cupin family protein